jgi:hypothetical protein
MPLISFKDCLLNKLFVNIHGSTAAYKPSLEKHFRAVLLGKWSLKYVYF